MHRTGSAGADAEGLERGKQSCCFSIAAAIIICFPAAPAEKPFFAELFRLSDASQDRSRRALLCHYCGYSIPVPHFCPNCGSEHLAFAGYGTQRIEDEIAAFLPEAKILRMDADTTKERFSQDEITAAFA